MRRKKYARAIASMAAANITAESAYPIWRLSVRSPADVPSANVKRMADPPPFAGVPSLYSRSTGPLFMKMLKIKSDVFSGIHRRIWFKPQFVAPSIFECATFTRPNRSNLLTAGVPAILSPLMGVDRSAPSKVLIKLSSERQPPL